MSDRCFVDTSILVYAHDRAAGSKHKRAQSLVENLWSSGTGVLSTQVLQELCVTIRRKASHPLPIEEFSRLIENYSKWEVVVNTAASITDALRIEARYKISFWDALILQAAESAGVETLYSEDLADGQKYVAVRVFNPFAQ